MEPYEAREIAAKAWCDSSTSHLDMIPELAEAFAKILVEEVGRASPASAQKVSTRVAAIVKAEENEAIIAAANALENIASTSSSTRIRRVANDALTAIRARRNHG